MLFSVSREERDEVAGALPLHDDLTDGADVDVGDDVWRGRFRTDIGPTVHHDDRQSSYPKSDGFKSSESIKYASSRRSQPAQRDIKLASCPRPLSLSLSLPLPFSLLDVNAIRANMSHHDAPPCKRGISRLRLEQGGAPGCSGEKHVRRFFFLYFYCDFFR
jgi:hypothetical protein